jgi:hypothetical protein
MRHHSIAYRLNSRRIRSWQFHSDRHTQTRPTFACRDRRPVSGWESDGELLGSPNRSRRWRLRPPSRAGRAKLDGGSDQMPASAQRHRTNDRPCAEPPSTPPAWWRWDSQVLRFLIRACRIANKFRRCCARIRERLGCATGTSIPLLQRIPGRIERFAQQSGWTPTPDLSVTLAAARRFFLPRNDGAKC